MESNGDIRKKFKVKRKSDGKIFNLAISYCIEPIKEKIMYRDYQSEEEINSKYEILEGGKSAEKVMDKLKEWLEERISNIEEVRLMAQTSRDELKYRALKTGYKNSLNKIKELQGD